MKKLIILFLSVLLFSCSNTQSTLTEDKQFIKANFPPASIVKYVHTYQDTHYKDYLIKMDNFYFRVTVFNCKNCEPNIEKVILVE